MKLGILTLILLIGSHLIGQNYADKNHYLIDSLDLAILETPDSLLIDSCLTRFHSATTDTAKAHIISNLVEGCYDEFVWPKYNQWEYDFVVSAIGRKPSLEEKAKLLNFKASAIGNMGFFHFSHGNSEVAMKYFLESLTILEQLDEPENLGNLLNNISAIYHQQGDIKKALKYHHKTILLRINQKDISGIAQSLNNIGYLFYSQGNIANALNCYLMSVKLDEQENNYAALAPTYSNLGLVYEDQGDIKQALIYYQKSLDFHKKNGNKSGAAKTLNNMGTVYEAEGEYMKALNMYKKSLDIKSASNDQTGMAYSLNNIGVVHFRLQQFDEALIYHERSLAIYEKQQDQQGMANALSNIGNVYIENKEPQKAIEMGLKCIDLSWKLGLPENIKKASQVLAVAYEQKEQGMKSVEMYKLFIQMSDSLNNRSTQRAAAQGQAKYAYEKQKVLDDAQHEKQLAVEQEAKKKQRVIIYSAILVLILIAVFLYINNKRLQLTRKQKVIIEEAHDELEEKNREILDSITYAKRIQSAILPPDKLVKEYLEQSFILYKPKDIVAGDFYWMEHKDDFVLFAAADCTGHGVPGAMVSVICNNGLNRSVREHGLSDPGKILDQTRKIVVEEFEKSEEDVMDGMDIALCALKGKSLKYAGAHNPLWIIRKNSTDIEEIKANKQPIGKYLDPSPYPTHEITLNEGDTIYIFSDGYVDQFGGEKGKKFKSRAFRDLLLSIQDKTMEEQKTIIDEVFEAWKGSLEQIDDVCVIGVRI